jgi:hypothetical protein
MPNPTAERRFPVAGALAALCAGILSQGFYCAEKHDPPGLPAATLTDIHLKIADPASGALGVRLAWDYPEGAKASYFEVYRATKKEQLKSAIHTQPADLAHDTTLALPDSSRPFTLYFAVRAVWVEPTGDKLIGDTLKIDSLRILPSLTILQPASGSRKSGRTLSMEVQTASDNGVMIRMSYFEKSGSAWPLKQDTCLPTDRCGFPIFGNSVQTDSLTLEQRAASDTVQALFCVVGTESFQDQTTGLSQSIGCTRFSRVGP